MSDLAWSPDNVHFATCGTDSMIIIWSINENCNYYFNNNIGAIKHIEAKANGITFDPFGKFMAT